MGWSCLQCGVDVFLFPLTSTHLLGDKIITMRLNLHSHVLTFQTGDDGTRIIFLGQGSVLHLCWQKIYCCNSVVTERYYHCSCLFVCFCFCLFVCLFFFSFAKCVTILVSFSSGKNDFPYFWAVTGALSLHNFQEVGIISFPAHIFVRRLVPPPQVLLQSCQSPTCHLYSEGHGFTLHFCHAAGGGSTWQKNPRLQQPFHSLALSRIRKR